MGFSQIVRRFEKWNSQIRTERNLFTIISNILFFISFIVLLVFIMFQLYGKIPTLIFISLLSFIGGLVSILAYYLIKFLFRPYSCFSDAQYIKSNAVRQFVNAFLFILFSIIALFVIYMGVQNLPSETLEILKIKEIFEDKNSLGIITLHIQIIEVILALLVLTGGIVGWYLRKETKKIEKYEDRINTLDTSIAISIQLALKELPKLSYTQHIPSENLEILGHIYEKVYNNKTIKEIFKGSEDEVMIEYVAGLHLFSIGRVECIKKFLKTIKWT